MFWYWEAAVVYKLQRCWVIFTLVVSCCCCCSAFQYSGKKCRISCKNVGGIMCLAFGQNLLMCCTWVKKSASSIMERPGQPSLHEVQCCFFVIMPSLLLFCENTSAYVCAYILYQTVSRTAQKGIWGDDTLQQLHPAGGTTASGLCSKSHKRKGEILVSKIEIFILEAKSVFALGSPQGSPQVTP